MINLHANQTQIISKFTSNISKNTSKSTSETTPPPIGVPSGLGPGNTLGRGSYACHPWESWYPCCPWPWVSYPLGQPRGQPLSGGGIHSREARGRISCSPRLCPPRCSGTVRGSRRASHRLLRTFLGDYGRIFVVNSRVLSPWPLVHTATCFFSRSRPPEESDNKRSSTRRGEFDSSTPEVIGVLLG